MTRLPRRQASSAAIADAPAPPAWPLTPLGATTFYLAVVALEQAFEVREQHEPFEE